ncbi:MAG: hypothetical protein AAFV53_43815 [Myxococcota bacterium]
MIEPLKASIVALEGSTEIDFLYNPKEFTLTRNSGFTQRSKGDGPYGGIHWECAKPDELKFDVVIDVSEPEINFFSPMAATQLLPISSLASLVGYADKTSVLPEIEKLVKLTKPGKVSMKLKDKTIEVHRPPFVAFIWGDFEFFGGIQSIDSKVVLFNPLGVPKRAEVSISMLGQAVLGKDTPAPKKAEEIAGYFGTAGYSYKDLAKYKKPSGMMRSLAVASLLAKLL